MNEDLEQKWTEAFMSYFTILALAYKQ